MRAELRLAIRLFAGTSGRDLARYVAVALAGALTAFSLALGICIAQLGQHEAAVRGARTPVRADTDTGLLVAQSALMIEGREWTRVLVTSSVARTPPPVGLDGWPAPGYSAVSPALAGLLQRPGFADLAGAVDESVRIGSDGLVNPGELFSYTVLDEQAETGTAYRAISGFAKGPRGADGDLLLMMMVVALILVVPCLMAFESAFGFLLTSRSRRFSILIRLGLSNRSMARLFSTECMIVTGAGVGLGLAMYMLTQGSIGASGVLAATWWPSSGEIPVFVVLIAVVVSMLLARRASRRMIERQRVAVHPSTKRELLRRPAQLLALAAASYLAGLVIYQISIPPTTRQPDFLAISVLAATGLGLVGLVVAMPAWSQLGARWIAQKISRPSARLGLRLAAHHVKAGSSFLVWLVILSSLSGCAMGFISGVGRWGSGYVSRQAFEVADLERLDRATTAALIKYLPFPAVLRAYDAVGEVEIVAGNCDAVDAYSRLVFGNPGNCEGDGILAGDGTGLPLPAEAFIGSPRISVPIPRDRVVQNVPWSLRLPASYQPELAAMDGSSLVISAQDEAHLVSIATYLHSAQPHVPYASGVKDSDAYRLYSQFSSLFLLAFGAAVLMSAASLAFLSMEVSWANARQIGALSAVGVSKRGLRLAAAVQATWPVIVAAPGVAFGILAGTAIRSYFGSTNMVEPIVFGAVIVPWVAAMLFAATCGAMAVVSRYSRSAVSDA